MTPPVRGRWSQDEDARLIALYPNTLTGRIATELGRSLTSTYQRAQLLGLAKSAAYLASPDACRLRRGDNVGAAYRFSTGHAPANKGLRRPGWGPGRMKDTQFRTGERRGVAVKLYKPIGTERVSKDGYLERKINDDLPPQRRWRAVHLLVWEAAHGPLPRGHAVVFTNGDRSDIRLANLACITRAELMRRNTVHNLPAPLPQMVQLIGALNRKINRRTRHDEEQDRGSTKPPVHGTGGAVRPGEADGDRTCASDRGLRESGSGVPRGDGSTRRDRVHRSAPRGEHEPTPTRRSQRTLVVARASSTGDAP